MENGLTALIGEKIRKKRIELGLNQIFFSRQLLTTQNVISNIENGKVKLSIERLLKVAEVLKVDLNYFVNSDIQDPKDNRIADLQNLVKRLETRNEILEKYILKFIETDTTK
jgi:transcriptional regulator with XRE-family HTH domain